MPLCLATRWTILGAFALAACSSSSPPEGERPASGGAAGGETGGSAVSSGGESGSSHGGAPGGGAGRAGDDGSAGGADDGSAGSAGKGEASCAGPPHTPGGPDSWGGCWPGAGNTGVPSGTTLTPYAGPCVVTEDDTVIDAMAIDCDLRIQAANVRITRCQINGSVATDAAAPAAIAE